MVTLHQKTFTAFISAEQIAGCVASMGRQISIDYDGLNPLIVPILNGAFMFAADLMRHITVPAEVSFIKVASYELTESKGEVEELLGLNADVAGRHVLLLEDIVDTGLTMQEVVRAIKELQPASVHIATLLLKPESLKATLQVRYTGFAIGQEFVVGYCMDYDGHGRNLPAIFVAQTN